METEQEPTPLTVSEYAEKWRVSAESVRRLVRTERLAHIRIGGAIRIMSDTLPHDGGMTPEYREQIAEIVRQSRAAQGLPEVVEDPAILAKVARILATSRTAVAS